MTGIRIEKLIPEREDAYDAFLHLLPSAMLFQSLRYRNFLNQILVNSFDHYLLAYDQNELIGALPVFIKKNEKYGNVINSLPFHGSNGSLLISPDCESRDMVKNSLLDAFTKLASDQNAVTSTLITNPLDPGAILDSEIQYVWRDVRIGQISPIPKYSGNDEELSAALMGSFHKKTRNSIRKAEKIGFVVSHSDSITVMQKLASLHQENLESIGALFKPWSVFQAIRENFRYDSDYRVYTAELEGEIVGALLVFFFNRTAEYFTPAAEHEFRSSQPVSLLAFEAMKDAARRGLANFNWGGTWETLDGVYRFKSRFGAQDKRYYYYIRKYGDALQNLSKETILSEYEYFYTIPFHELGNEHAEE